MNVLPTKDELEVMEHIANILIKSGFYPQLKSHEQAVATILRGWGLGLSPADSLSGINILHGKLTMSSGLIASLMMRAGFSWKSVSHTEQECIIEVFSPDKELLGQAGFSMEDAKRAQLISKNQNWNIYPKDMLFARTISAAARRYAPIAFGGAVYTPDELQDSNTNSNNQPAAANITPLVQPAQTPEIPAELSSTQPRTEKQNTRMHKLYNVIYQTSDDAILTPTRRAQVAVFTKTLYLNERHSSTELTEGEMVHFLKALETMKSGIELYGELWESEKESELCARASKDAGVTVFQMGYTELEKIHSYLINKLAETKANENRRF